MSKDAPEVLAYRVQRLQKAPRNWSYWIAAFTAVNGLLVAASPDTSLPAGMVLPYILDGSVPHFIAAILLVGLIHAGGKDRMGPRIVLSVYFLDAVLAAAIGDWLAVGLHVAVLAFIGFAWNGARLLQKMPTTSG